MSGVRPKNMFVFRVYTMTTDYFERDGDWHHDDGTTLSVIATVTMSKHYFATSGSSLFSKQAALAYSAAYRQSCQIFRDCDRCAIEH